MGYNFHDLVGNTGVVLILLTFLLVQLRKMDATGFRYLVANGLGALFILYSLFFDFNLSAFIIESAWLLISVVGLGRIFLERQVR
jgi:hypothetical protein